MLVGKRPGLVQFELNYSGEGLSTVSRSERLQIAHFGRCIACGLCDRGDAGSIVKSHGKYRSTMSLVLAASRSMPEFKAAQASFGVLDRQQLLVKEQLCPARVPITELAAFVAHHANSVAPPIPTDG